MKELKLSHFALVASCLLALAAVGNPQAWRKRALAAEHSERMQDPPVENTLSPTAAGRIETFRDYTAIQVNINSSGQNIPNDAANEPSITVDPTNPNRLAIGWRQFNNKSSNFRQGGYGYSTNGGLTWTFPGVLENNVFRSDPVLDSAPTGQLYYLSLKESFYDDLFSSLNGGASWSKVGAATGGDKEWFVVDRTDSSGRGFIYQCWSVSGNNYGTRQFSRSTDGGVSWMNPIDIPGQPFWGTPTIGQNGNVYIGGTDGTTEDFRVVRSTNAKNGSVTPSFDLSKLVSLGGVITYGVPVNPDGLGGQTWCLADPSTNNVYLLCSVDRGGSNPLDVMFARSTDGGNSWSTPKRINDDAANQGNYHWFGTLGVAPNGRLDAIWMDTRLDSNRRMSAMYYSYSTDFGVTWSANIRITPTFDPNIGYPNQNKIGDYMTMVSDNQGAHVAFSATWNGEQDVYYVRIPALNTLAPDDYLIMRGVYISGGLSELAFSDDSPLVVRSQYLPSLPGSPIQVQFKAHSSVTHPSSLKFKFEARASQNNVTQKLLLFSYQSNAYELVDVRPATTTDSVVTITATGDLSRFVNPADGEVRALATYDANPGPGIGWQALVDQVQWTISP